MAAELSGRCDSLGYAIRGTEQMSYVESNLVPGETVIYETRLHWIVILWHIVLGCLLLGLPGCFWFITRSARPESRARLYTSWKAGASYCSFAAPS